MRMLKLAAAALAALTLGGVAVTSLWPANAAEEGHGGHGLREPAAGWSFEGPFGYFQPEQLQRGFKVYAEVCSSCHAMRLMSYRNLGQQGGPFYDRAYANPNDNPRVKAIAAMFTTPRLDPETGEQIVPVPPAIPSDTFQRPYPNDIAARGANGGALPPDLSVIVKARHGGASYVYSFLTGFAEHAPQGLTVNAGQHYNTAFNGDTASQWSGDPRAKPPGGFTAMAPQLPDGRVKFDDGSPSTTDQMAQDVAAFLAWASEPKQQIRKQMGIAVLGFLAIFAVVVYLSYRQIWRNVEH
jgi:ubiquinol-cytochrome c reductase cytochrome c1 subunit